MPKDEEHRKGARSVEQAEPMNKGLTDVDLGDEVQTVEPMGGQEPKVVGEVRKPQRGPAETAEPTPVAPAVSAEAEMPQEILRDKKPKPGRD